MQVDINPNQLDIEFVEQLPIVKELVSDAKNYRDMMNEVKIPFIIKDKVLLTEGTWNDNFYSEIEIEKAIKKTNWSDKIVRSLFLDHLDGLDPTDPKQGTQTWVGEVENVRYVKGMGAVGDLVILDHPTAIKLAWGAKFGVSAKLEGNIENNSVSDFHFLNNSIVINPACKKAWINNAEVSKIQNQKEDINMVEEKKIELTDLLEKIEKLSEAFNDRLSKIEAKLQEETETKVEEKIEPVKEEPKEAKEPEIDTAKELAVRDEKISELTKQIEQLNERFNEPEKITEKVETETKVETLEDKIKGASNEEINEAMAKLMLRAQGAMNLRK